MSTTVCTLFEGHYHLGAGALINSLHVSGYTGRVVCGYRGALPDWANSAQTLSERIEVSFVALAPKVHFTYYKPRFLQECWELQTPGAEQLFYFDPDIVVKAPWTVIERWGRDGIALCEDVNNYMPAGHPYRLAWSDFLNRHALHVVRPLDRYYNAGFIGLPRTQAGFLETWRRIVDCAANELGELDRLKVDRPHALFHSADQDAMNMALMVGQNPINATGPEGMDFLPGGHLLSHAIGRAKPWRGGFFRNALRGKPPSLAHKSFFRFASRPLQLFPPAQLARLRLSLQTGALLGRLYRRA